MSKASTPPAERRWGRGERTDSNQARQRILAAARQCYSRKGIAATTMSDVAAAAGVVRGTLYRYFPRKEAILLYIFREETAKFLDRFREETPAPPSFCDYLLAYLMYSLRYAPQTPMHQELFSEQSALWVSRNYLDDPDTLALTETLFREPFRSAQAAGELREDLSLEEVVRWCARVLVSYILVPEAAHRSDAEYRQLFSKMLLSAIANPERQS